MRGPVVVVQLVVVGEGDGRVDLAEPMVLVVVVVVVVEDGDVVVYCCCCWDRERLRLLDGGGHAGYAHLTRDAIYLTMMRG